VVSVESQSGERIVSTTAAMTVREVLIGRQDE